jgi:hypothetical protein
VRTQHGTRLVNSDEDEKSETYLLRCVGRVPIFCDSVVSARSTGFAGPDTLTVCPWRVKAVLKIITVSQ